MVLPRSERCVSVSRFMCSEPEYHAALNCEQAANGDMVLTAVNIPMTFVR